MKNKYLYLDFEFFNSVEKFIDLVCCSTFDGVETREFWLLDNPEEHQKLWDYFEKRLDHVFVSFSVQSEARSIISLLGEYQRDDLPARWIDLHLEWKCLINHNNKLAYGKQLIDGKVQGTFPPKPKWVQSEEDKLNHSKTETNLSAMVYKLLNKVIDTKHKEEMREIIISKDKELIKRNRKDIMEYCTSDIKYLPELLKETVRQYSTLLNRYAPIELPYLVDEMINRADYAVRTAIMETVGYPIDVEATKNFSSSVKRILNDMSREINSLFPEISPFRYNIKENKFSMVQANIRKWVMGQKLSNWMLTDQKDLSLALDAFTKHFDFKHEYPTDNFGAQMVRYLKTKQSLNGFMPLTKKSKRKSFWESVGSDGRVRPYFNIYGAQSSRSQPSSTGFIPLKAAWMRSLIQPKPGKAICGIDFSSQEFLISALNSKDDMMINAYKSGDVYLFFAKEAGAVPPNGTKKEYLFERDLFKGTTLGISYDMTKVGLSRKLTNDLGKFISEDEAQIKIDQFNNIFKKFAAHKEKVHLVYLTKKFLKLPCGWYMWGDNPNQRSIGNCPIQGLGASIMRKSVQLAQDRGCDVIFTLHDAIYIEYDKDDMGKISILEQAMRDGFKYYFEDKENANLIRMEATAWSPDYNEGEANIDNVPVKFYKIYVDPRGKKDYEKFKVYFTKNNADLL